MHQVARHKVVSDWKYAAAQSDQQFGNYGLWAVILDRVWITVQDATEILRTQNREVNFRRWSRKKSVDRVLRPQKELWKRFPYFNDLKSCPNVPPPQILPCKTASHQNYVLGPIEMAQKIEIWKVDFIPCETQTEDHSCRTQSLWPLPPSYQAVEALPHCSTNKKQVQYSPLVSLQNGQHSNTPHARSIQPLKLPDSA